MLKRMFASLPDLSESTIVEAVARDNDQLTAENDGAENESLRRTIEIRKAQAQPQPSREAGSLS
jgi:hypothetical protein